MIETLVEEGAKGFKLESFQRLRIAVGIARERAKDCERKAAREELERKLEAMRAELQAKVSAADKALEVAVSQCDKAEKEATPLISKIPTLSSAEMVRLADSTDELIREAKESTASAKKEYSGLNEGVHEDLAMWLNLEVKKLEVQPQHEILVDALGQRQEGVLR